MAADVAEAIWDRIDQGGEEGGVDDDNDDGFEGRVDGRMGSGRLSKLGIWFPAGAVVHHLTAVVEGGGGGGDAMKDPSSGLGNQQW